MKKHSNRLVEIVPLQVADAELLSGLAASIESVFPCTCKLGPILPLPPNAYDSVRGQYHATRLLEYLDQTNVGYYRRLAVVEVDLFIPIMRFVFGEAMLSGTAAVFSTYRLGGQSGPEQRQNRRVFLQRAIKEGLHELGHTFSLTHCSEASCLMAAALDVDQIDGKSMSLCAYCRIDLDSYLEENF